MRIYYHANYDITENLQLHRKKPQPEQAARQYSFDQQLAGTSVQSLIKRKLIQTNPANDKVQQNYYRLILDAYVCSNEGNSIKL